MSLRTRIQVLTVSVAALAVAVCSIVIYVVTADALRTQLADRVARDADDLVAGEVSGGTPAVFGGFAAGPGEASYLRVVLVSSAGQMYTATGTYAPFASDDGDFEPEIASVVRGDLDRLETDLHGFAVVAVKAPSGATLLVGESYKSLDGVLGGLVAIFTVVGAALVVLAAGAGYAVAGTGLRPVGRLTRATRRVSDTGDLSPVEVAGDDELAHLAARFNDMLDALRRSRQSQNQLIVDAGRELLSPLTALRTNIELLVSLDRVSLDRGSGERGPMSPDAVDRLRRDIVDQLEEVALRIHRLVDDARAADTAATSRVP